MKNKKVDYNYYEEEFKEETENKRWNKLKRLKWLWKFKKKKKK